MFLVTYIYIRIIAFTVNLVICCQTAVIFGGRVRNNHTQARIMHLTGLLASISGITYGSLQLARLFGGPAVISCDNILIVGGCLITGGISLALLHLFLRADLINRKNNKHWVICRVISSFFMIFNIVSFSIYLSLRDISQSSNDICVYELNQKALILRYVAQAMNHTVQTILFIYPLTKHIRHMKNIQEKQQLESNIDNSIYIILTYNAILAMIISSTYTLCLVVVVCFYKNNEIIQRITIPLSNFDMALTLGSVCYASTCVTKKKKRPSLIQQSIRRPSMSYRHSSYTPSIDEEV